MFGTRNESKFGDSIEKLSQECREELANTGRVLEEEVVNLLNDSVEQASP